MEYKLNIPLSFHQLLDLIQQLPAPVQRRLITTLEKQQVVPKIQMKTIEQVKNKNYIYPTNKNPQSIIGIWENEPEIDSFFDNKK